MDRVRNKDGMDRLEERGERDEGSEERRDGWREGNRGRTLLWDVRWMRTGEDRRAEDATNDWPAIEGSFLKAAIEMGERCKEDEEMSFAPDWGDE